jgi:hypothetical protein
VLAALHGDLHRDLHGDLHGDLTGTRSGFGAPVPADSLATELGDLPGGADADVHVDVGRGSVTVRLPVDERDRGAFEARALAAAYALGWAADPPDDPAEHAVLLRFSTPTP